MEPTHIPRRLFVYGSLMEGFFNSPYLVGKVASRWPAQVHGTLYHLPRKGYPALVAGGSPIAGELLELLDFRRDIPLLDRLENFYAPKDPRNEYERQVTRARITATGQVTDAYVYRYVEGDPLSQGGLFLPEGSWRAYMEDAGATVSS